MTKKLYYQDAYLKEFVADIVDYFEEDGEYHLKLNQSAFYPEGGGQAADKGFIGNKKVKYVYEKNKEIYHIVDSLPEARKNIKCKIDWERRFDLMQQHTGQHLFSAVLDKLAAAKTLSVHLGESVLTIDINKKLDENMIRDIEIRTNEIIYENHKITAEFPAEQKLNEIKMRKDPKVKKNIRIVKIKDIDICPCGGTHLKRTGEIGILKIIDYKNYKGGMRIYFLTGKRALNDYEFKNNIVLKARYQFGVKDDQINNSIEELKKEVDFKQNKIDKLKEEILDYYKKEIISKASKLGDYNLIIKNDSNLDLDNLKRLANKIVSEKNNIIIFGQKEDNTARVLIAKSKNIKKFKVDEILDQTMGLLNGGGGGHEYFAQGGGSMPEKLDEALKKAKKLFENEM